MAGRKCEVRNRRRGRQEGSVKKETEGEEGRKEV